MDFKKIFYVILSVLFIINQSGLAMAAEEVKINWVDGPQNVSMGTNLAKFKIPEKYVFADGEDAKKLMEYFGNATTGTEIGMVVPKDKTKSWFVIFDYDDIGYVNDNDATNLDADGLLASITAGTEVDNEDRKAQGAAPLNILGWGEKPSYDSKTNHMVWSFVAESEGNRLINYNVGILGRHGITSVTIIADEQEFATIKPELETIVKNYEYVPGEKYSDYVPGQDKVAPLGLTAIISGGEEAAATTTANTSIFDKGITFVQNFWYLLLGVVGVLIIIIKGLFKKAENLNPKAAIIKAEHILAEQNAAISEMAFSVEDSEVEGKVENKEE